MKLFHRFLHWFIKHPLFFRIIVSVISYFSLEWLIFYCGFGLFFRWLLVTFWYAVFVVPGVAAMEVIFEHAADRLEK